MLPFDYSLLCDLLYVGKSEGKNPLGRKLCRRNNGIKIIPQHWDRAWNGLIWLMKGLSGWILYLNVTNKMQNYTMTSITINFLHVSGGSSAHHQELKTVYTATDICRAFTASYRLLPLSIIRSSKLYKQHRVFVELLLLLTACFLRPSSGAQNCIQSIGYLSNVYCFLPLTSSAHHQELKTIYKASGICRSFTASYRLLPPPIIRSSKLYTQHRVFVELLLPLTACFLRPSSGAQNCIHSIGYLSNVYCFLPLTSSAHHQELKTIYKASGICRSFTASYRLFTQAVRSSKISTNTRCSVYSFELLMMGEGTA